MFIFTLKFAPVKKIKFFLKQSLPAIILMILSFPLFAQPDSLVNLPNLLLPKFTRSIVKLKSGEVNTAYLNYNTVDQEMVFMQKKLFLVLDEPQLIDTVFMANRTFIPFEKGFYELVVNNKITLFKQNKSYVESEGSPTGYGAKSQTTAPSYVKQVFASNGSLDLNIPSGYKVVDDSNYWVRREKGMSVFDNKRQFLKIFPDKEDELNKYINKYHTDFKSDASVVALINYCNELYK